MPGALFFDVTPSYITLKKLPEILNTTMPGVRAVVILRDPVERYLSALTMSFRCNTCVSHMKYFDKWRSGVDIVMALKKQFLSPPDILWRGFYVKQLRPWMHFFGRDKLLILFSEELYSRPVETAERVLRFMGIHLPGFDFQPQNVLRRKGKQCKKDCLKSIFGEGERKLLRDFYAQKNRLLPELIGMWASKSGVAAKKKVQH